MSVREFLEKNGWGRTVLKGHHYMTVCIQFLNDKKMEDETEFDISACDVDELEELFQNFCQENGFAVDTVTDVYVVRTAITLEEL